MRSIEGFLEELSSIDIITRLSFASTTSSFIRLLGQLQIYRELCKYLKSTPDSIGELCISAQNIIDESGGQNIIKFADYIVATIICSLRTFNSVEIDELLDDISRIDIPNFIWTPLLTTEFQIERVNNKINESQVLSHDLVDSNIAHIVTIKGLGTRLDGIYGQT